MAQNYVQMPRTASQIIWIEWLLCWRLTAQLYREICLLGDGGYRKQGGACIDQQLVDILVRYVAVTVVPAGSSACSGTTMVLVRGL